MAQLHTYSTPCHLDDVKASNLHPTLHIYAELYALPTGNSCHLIGAHEPADILLQRQTFSQNRSIPNHSAQPRQVDQSTDAMQYPKLLVQHLHLLAMRPSIVALLSIPGLLMLPQTHDFGSLGANVNQIYQRCYKHGRMEP